MPNKNLYYTKTMQAKVNELMTLLEKQGVTLRNQWDKPSDSQLFEWLVDQELARQQSETPQS